MVAARPAGDVFNAVATPVRRRLLDLLAQRERTVSDLVPRFRMSQPALSQHLKVLRDAGLVSVEQRGRHRHYRAAAGRLKEIRDWVARYERLWDERLGALGAVLDEIGGKQ